MFEQALEYALKNSDEFIDALMQHLHLVGLALGTGMAVCIPLGILTARSKLASVTIINAFNSLRVAPSLAILFLVIPFTGLGMTSASIALIILALPPILINTDASFRSISPAIRESARGMGMTATQVLFRIELPLAIPVILAGIRMAAVEVIASATLAAFIGTGGLGIYVTRGFALYDISILLVGAAPVAFLALSVELGMTGLQKALEAPG